MQEKICTFDMENEIEFGGYYATIKILKKLCCSSKVSGKQIVEIGKAIQCLEELPSLPQNVDIEISCRGEYCLSFDFGIDGSRMYVILGSSERYEAGIETFTEYSFYLEDDGFWEERGGSYSYAGFVEEIDPEYFEVIDIYAD